MEFIEELFNLKNKNVLITGGNSGLGLKYAEAFAKAGANLAIAHLDHNLAAIKALAKKYKVQLVLSQGDLRKSQNIEKFVASAYQAFKKIDVLINNAGINLRIPALQFSEAKWDSVLDINLKAAFFLAQAVAKIMKKQGFGKIINIASLRSFQAGSASAAYSASKHAILGITRALANELSQFNIQINAIAPGYFITEQTQYYLDNPKLMAQVTTRIPAQRWGLAQDLVGAIIFLASQASDYLSGSVIVIDGGYLIR